MALTPPRPAGYLAALALCACGGLIDDPAAPPGAVESPAPAPAAPSPVRRPPTTTPAATSTWQWLAPNPTGEHLYAAWAASPSDVWLVGDEGTIVRWDGAESLTVARTGGSRRSLRAVCGARGDVWAAGGGALLHFDGRAWTEQPAADLTKLACDSRMGAWVGLRADGRLENHTSGALAEWRTARDVTFVDGDLWVVGDAGKLTSEHHRGGLPVDATGARSPTDPGNDYFAVSGASASDVWAAFRFKNTGGPLCLGLTHWDGSALRVEHTVCASDVAYGPSTGLVVSGDNVVSGFTRRLGRSGAWDDTPAPRTARGALFDGGGGRVLALGHARWASYSEQDADPTQMVVYEPATARTTPLHGGYSRDLMNVTVDARGRAWAESFASPHDDDAPAHPVDVVRWDRGWVSQALPTGFTALGARGYGGVQPLHAVGPSVWVAGARSGRPSVAEWDGGVWREHDEGLPSGATISALDGAGDELWVELYRPEAHDDPQRLYRLRGRAGDVRRVFEPVLGCEPPQEGPRASPVGLTMRCGDVQRVWRGDRLELLAPHESRYTWAASERDVWLGTVHFDGGQLSGGHGDHLPIGGAATDLWFASWGSARASVAHWDGARLEVVRPFDNLGGAAFGGGSLWLVGEGGRTLRYGPPMDDK